MDPVVTFKKLIPNGRPPQRASRDVGGTLPMRGVRFCHPLTSASAFGWYLFPPITFQLRWLEARDVLWTWEGAPDNAWFPLQSAQFPHFAAGFDEAAPEDCRGFSPPFVALGEDNGIIQIWSGLIARTAPDWSLLVRAVANLPRSRGYEQLEGIIETDRWFGPLFTNIRLTRTDIPITFADFRPFLQVQPVHRSTYDDDFLNAAAFESGVDALTLDDWRAYHATVVQPNCALHRPRGGYAVAARKRRKRDPFDTKA
jgi:hypothetical protein